ncbi:glucosamine-6-phosphate deaminase [Cyclobacterium plantarum]|uniref:Glucosamine-6-phosphate deaminase n=1 Tax=Cyclobacterium plantarum TaxID=2716263 RepID=A0ABX0H6Y4_9BACT|nr:glucosamine-6-phosphate deaminase [Cyclobacterium plantarum]NHE56089.1 glucosamine-6-phosphate deaminase [Cyclobacterium plantarum]
MKIYKRKNPLEMGKLAGDHAAKAILAAINSKGSANIILATGTSQFETIKTLLTHQEIDWSKVTMFHLDEYLGLPITHPASFRKYLKERFLDEVKQLKAYHLIDGEKDPQEETERLGKLILAQPIDVALVGIGENGHLAFNDPPANFSTEVPYLVVDLDEDCRKQQLGEGWFPNLEAVPKQAISMSIQQIMKSNKIICSVPDERKAHAVKSCLENKVSPEFPASILQQHPDCALYLDEASASLLSQKVSFN